MIRISRISRLSAAGLALLPALASAHPGHYHPGEEDEFESLANGFLHPFTGLDHLLLALAAGCLFTAFLKDRGLKPAGAFLASLMAGGVLGYAGGAFPGLELAVALTVGLAGVLFFVLKAEAKAEGGEGLKRCILPTLAVAALLHGIAHGSETPAGGGFTAYAAGFLVGNAVLLGLGSLIPRLGGVPLSRLPWLFRVAGGALVGASAVLALQTL